MKELKTGQFFGQTNGTVHLEGYTLTDTEYTIDKVDWHYHENAYFTFILAGNIVEGNKKNKHHCSSGSLLFHNWQEPHYNIKPGGYTRGFHIEIKKEWFDAALPANASIEGNLTIVNPDIKIIFYNIVKEFRIKIILSKHQ
jgi:AraC family transcriptional regulator